MSDDLSIPNPDYRGSRAGRYGTGPARVRPGMDPDTRRLMMFAGGLGAVLLVLIGASTLMGRHSGEIPVVSPDPRPIREKPANPGGMKIDGADNDVFSGGTDSGASKLAPRAEVPDTRALQAAAASSPAPVSENAAPAVEQAIPDASVSANPVAAKPAAHPPVAMAPPPVDQSAPVARPAVTDRPAVTGAPPAKARPPAAVAETRAAPSGRQPMVQLAALGSEEAARAEWETLVKKMPELLGGRQPSYSRTEHDGHTFWRIRTSGFADVAQARGFCEHVRAKGAGCSVADF